MSQPIIVSMNVSASNQSVPMNTADNLEQMTFRVGAEIGYKGEKGDTGVGIASIRLNEDYTLTIALTDGTAYTTDSIRGERGEQGVPGEKGERGIQGEQGEKGLQGEPGIPGEKGDKGDPGEKGEPGMPGAKGDKGDKGDTGASGADGKDGVNGQDGTDGADGFSPVANVSKSGNTTTITITDKNGTTTATVNDGVGDVASVNGKTGAVVLDAADVGALPDDTAIPTKTSDLTNDSGFITDSDIATDNALGLMKTNPAKNITLNADNQLEVGGRLGQFPGTSGIYAPNDRDPRIVNNYSFLITDAMGIDFYSTRSIAVVSGYSISCKSANAGATEYHLSNTYENRIYAKCAEGGYAALDEATSTVQRIVPVVSVQIGGADYTPNSDANSSSAVDDIVIKTEESLNPTAATTKIRLFGKMRSFASFHVGNGIASGDDSSGRSLMLGGGITKAAGNDNCMVGMGLFSSGNGNAIFGRYHIAKKNRGFFAGTGHDSTNARNEAVSAVGEYSSITRNTLFAVGNGTSHTARRNAFEVTIDGGFILNDSNGGRWKITVNTSGNLTATAVT